VELVDLEVCNLIASYAGYVRKNKGAGPLELSLSKEPRDKISLESLQGLIRCLFMLEFFIPVRL